MDLIRELGLADDVIGSNDHLRITFVRKNGRLVPLPDGLMMMVPTKILPLVTTPLLSWGTKIRMGMELLRAPKPKRGDESVADFVRGALRPGGGGLSGRAAALRHLRRRSARAQRHAACCRASSNWPTSTAA